MRLINLNKSSSIVAIAYDLLPAVRGTGRILGGAAVTVFTMVNVTALNYQTVFLMQHRVEDVGSLEVMSILFGAFFFYNGNGSIRWQISGDGGSTFVTIAEGSFNVGVNTADLVFGSGLWITSIQPGDNKLQVRMQVKSTLGGIVSTFIEDDSIIFLTYRKKVLF